MNENEKKYQKLTEEADALQNEYSSRKFSYDPEADAGYKEYARLMRESGKKAMEDTVGKASALTGGYANSFAASAGAGAYGDYMKQAADAQLAFRQQARSEFDAESQDILNRLGIINNQRAAMYTPPSEDQIAYAKEIYKTGGETALDNYTASLTGVDVSAILSAVEEDELSFRKQFKLTKDGGKNFGGAGTLDNNAEYTMTTADGKIKTMSTKDWVKYLQDPNNGYGMTEKQAKDFMLSLQDEQDDN